MVIIKLTPSDFNILSFIWMILLGKFCKQQNILTNYTSVVIILLCNDDNVIQTLNADC